MTEKMHLLVHRSLAYPLPTASRCWGHSRRICSAVVFHVSVTLPLPAMLRDTISNSSFQLSIFQILPVALHFDRKFTKARDSLLLFICTFFSTAQLFFKTRALDSILKQ